MGIEFTIHLSPFLNCARMTWYEMHRISQAKATEVAGLSQSEFLMALARFDVSPFQYDADEIVAEVAGG